MRKFLSILAYVSTAFLLVSCDDTTGASEKQTITSAPITFSHVALPDSIAKYTQDTIILDMGIAKGLHGEPAPFSDPALGYAIGSVGDTVCLMIPNVPDSVKWEAYMGEKQGFNRVSEVLFEILYDSVPSEGHNTLIYKMVAHHERAHIQGFAANRYGDVAESYYANINYCFGVRDSLYFETDSPVWELGEANSMGQTAATLHLSGKTNALRAEVYCWGDGVSHVQEIELENGHFDTAVYLGVTASLSTVKTKIYVYGSEHGYETIEISSADK